MKILITGGAGFIGSNLCDYFIAKGYKVVCLDNLSTGFKTNLDEITDHPNFTFIEGDIPHSQASILKAKTILNYQPQYSAEEGFAKACEWYFENIKA